MTGQRCYVAGCAGITHIGKICGKHWHKLPLHMRPDAWKGDVTEALKYLDPDKPRK